MLFDPTRAGLLLAAVALSITPATAAAKPKAQPKPKPGLKFLDANVSYTSIITTRCPAIVGINAFTTDVTTTIYRHTVKGTGPSGKSRGTMEVTGEQTYQVVRTVEGESDTIKPYTVGPTKRPIATRSTTWGGVVRVVTTGKKKRKPTQNYLDFTGVDPTLDAGVFVPIPKKVEQHTYSITGEPKTKDHSDQGGGCTSSEVVTVTGSVTFGRKQR